MAWLITSVYYFYQYMMRSAPAVMVPELTAAFGVTAAASPQWWGSFIMATRSFSLWPASPWINWVRARSCRWLRDGRRRIFATGDPTIASFGRFLQGCAGVFALIGAAYIATTNFPASRAATLIGATQMFGMAGGSAGQFLVGPAIGGGLAWNQFWMIMGIIGPLIALALWYFIPARKVEASPDAARGAWAGKAARAMGLVFRNPQSIFCGLIAGFMFLPTTIFDMVWGVRFLQESHDVSYSMAVLRSASVPFGWIIGCPFSGSFPTGSAAASR